VQNLIKIDSAVAALKKPRGFFVDTSIYLSIRSPSRAQVTFLADFNA